MININLIKKILGFKIDAPAKWYGVTQTGKAETPYAVTRSATENTSTAPTEMDSAIELFCREAIKQLLDGKTVYFGRYGTFHIAFQSNGVEDINDYNVNSMIKNSRIVFRASKVFRAEVINNLQFKVTGVTEDDVKYASLPDYRRAKGISSDPSDPSGGGDGGIEDDPLG